MRACLPIIGSFILLATSVVAQELPGNALPVGHWSFDEGEGIWAGDQTGFSNRFPNQSFNWKDLL